MTRTALFVLNTNEIDSLCNLHHLANSIMLMIGISGLFIESKQRKKIQDKPQVRK